MTERHTRRDVLRGLAGAAALTTGASVQGAARPSDDAPYSRTDVRIESWDGTELAASIYVPDRGGPRPAIVGTHGWGGDRSSAVVTRLAETYAAHGYLLVTYDSRGFGESGGEANVDGPREVADALTVFDGLAQGELGGESVNVRTDDNGPVVGMDGLSYAGGIQLNTMAVSSADATARLLPDGASFETLDFSKGSPLNAAVPRWAWHDLRFSLAPRDVVKSGWDTLLAAVGATGSRGLTSGDGRPDVPRDVRYGMDTRIHSAFAGSLVTNDMEEEEFYAERSPVSKTDLLDTPSLFISGWNDTLFTGNEAIWNYQAVRSNDAPAKILFFQGGHTFGETPDEETQAYIDRRARQFLDAHLRGQGESDLPAIEYYETQTGEWSTVPDVHPPQATDRTFPLAAASEGDASVVANSVAPTSVSQLAVGQQGDYAAGATAVNFDFPVTESIEVFGVPRLRLVVEPLGEVADLFVKVFHVSDGSADLVHNQVTPIEIEGAGEVHELAVEMTALQRHFDAGDTLRLTVASTDAGFNSARQAAGARIHHANADETAVTFPVLSGNEGGRQPR